MHSSVGGMGYIDFYDYYTATILTQLKERFLPLPDTLWGKIEASSIPKKSLLPWLFGTQLGSHIPSFLSPTMLASVNAWHILNRLAPNCTERRSWDFI